jgi:hypothetical protein
MVSALAGLLAACFVSGAIAQPTSFVGVLNSATSNADSRRSVTFYDGADIGAGPLFSVFLGFEIHGSSSNSYEDPSAITVDPATGDVYILAFDSGQSTSAGVVDINPPGPENGGTGDAGAPAVDTPDDDDTIADWDLYRINFQTVFDHWNTNFRGHDVRDPGDPAPDVGNNAPVATAGTTAAELADYITYGTATPYVEERMLDATHGPSVEGVFDNLDVDGAGDSYPSHANTFVLAGAIEKIGELSRNRYPSGSNFHKPTIEFIDGNTLIMVDDTRQRNNSGHNVANDNDFRMIEQDLDGTAEIDGSHINGGYNNTTTEAWESRRIAQLNLDTDETTSGSFLSELQSSAYYDNGAGVRGVWVADRDRDQTATYQPIPDTYSGDDIAFLQLDSSNNSLGYRTIADFAATKFNMPNNPAAPDGFAGRVGQLFVDSDTGDLIVVEEGGTDSTMPSTGTPGPGLSEPATIRVPVNYDAAGQIDLGAWGAKTVLGANGGILKDTDDVFRENGYWSAYDSATDTVYFVSAGEAVAGIVNPPGPDPPSPLVHFAMDIYTMNVNTGLTQSFLNVDGSVSLFFSGFTNSNTPNGDEIIAFSLAPPEFPGDFNEDGKVDAADYVVWRKNGANPLPNDTGLTTSQARFDLWRANFGNMQMPGGGSGGAVPEPASAVLMLLGLAVVGWRRRAA